MSDGAESGDIAAALLALAAAVDRLAAAITTDQRAALPPAGASAPTTRGGRF